MEEDIMNKKVSFLLLLALVLAASVFSIALACDGGHSRETSWGNQDKVFASISACSCSPRANHLYASTRAQVEDQYGYTYWMNWVESYGDNVSYKSSTSNPANPIIGGIAHFRHSCTTGGSPYTYHQHYVTIV
jgi:hypothetical protein